MPCEEYSQHWAFIEWKQLPLLGIGFEINTNMPIYTHST